MKYIFQLGHQPQISAAEIGAVFAQQYRSTLAPKHFSTTTREYQGAFLILDVNKKLNCEELINILGGTVKIGKRIDGDIVDYLNGRQPAGKIIFSLPDRKLAINIKKQLKQAGRSARYIEPKNTATILHNNLVELGGDLTIVNGEIFATEAIQPFEEFSERDYGRPGSDDMSGMLPPKLARIMINLAQIPKDAVILDPFCGSGTILTEAASLGYRELIANDISEKAIQDTKKNIDWTKNTYHISHITYQLFETQTTRLSEYIGKASVNAIITEPLLGKPLTGKETKIQLQSQANELAQLYIDSFKSFSKILKPNGVVLFIIPKFRSQNEWVEINCVDKIKKTGFKTVQFEILGGQPAEHLTYHRPNQHLARTIWRFQRVGIGN